MSWPDIQENTEHLAGTGMKFRAVTEKSMKLTISLCFKFWWEYRAWLGINNGLKTDVVNQLRAILLWFA